MDKQETARNILTHALPNVPFEGWTEGTLESAALKTGLKPGEIARVFPSGVMDALEFWSQEADLGMEREAALLPLGEMKIRERIAALIKLRLEQHIFHREALRASVHLYFQPWHAARGLRNLHRTVDAIWRLAGDKSVDFNWYSKRFLLANVYSVTLLRWLNDAAEDRADTWAFLQRRIDNVIRAGAWLPFGAKRKA